MMLMVMFLVVILGAVIWFYDALSEEKAHCPDHGVRPVRRVGNARGDWFRCSVQGCGWKLWEPLPEAAMVVIATCR